LDSESLPTVGQVMADRYLLEEQVGRGAMGVVYRAIDQDTGDTVAVKTLRFESGFRLDYFERFRREVAATGQLESEHAARFIDIGVGDDGQPFMVMEFLEGDTLAAALKTGTIEPRRAIRIVLEACDAVGEAHTHGIVHRDIKPSNVFQAEGDGDQVTAKVLDFGVSKILDDDPITRTDTVLGSPLYMAPEQILSSKGVDQRADIYSLGVILYKMLCGRPPFFAKNFVDLVVAIRKTTPRPLDEMVPNLPEGLEPVVLRCIDADPAKRYPDVPALVEALKPVLEQASKQSEFANDGDDEVTTAMDRGVFEAVMQAKKTPAIVSDADVTTKAQSPSDSDRTRPTEFDVRDGTEVMPNPELAASADASGPSLSGADIDDEKSTIALALADLQRSGKQVNLTTALLIAFVAFVVGAAVVSAVVLMARGG
jgi:serine/threonine-protein kinase